MAVNQNILILGVAVVVCTSIFFLVNQSKKNAVRRRAEIDEYVRRVRMANDPNYRRPKDDMDAFIEDGVIKYRRKRKKK